MTTPESVTLTLTLTVNNTDGSTAEFIGAIDLSAVEPEVGLPENLPFDLA